MLPHGLEILLQLSDLILLPDRDLAVKVALADPVSRAAQLRERPYDASVEPCHHDDRRDDQGDEQRDQALDERMPPLREQVVDIRDQKERCLLTPLRAVVNLTDQRMGLALKEHALLG